MLECSRGVDLVVGLLFFTTSLVVGDQPRSLTPREQYEALLKDYERASATWKQSGRGLKLADPAWREHHAAWPKWSFGPRFLQFAEANPTEPEAVDALLQIVGFLESLYNEDRLSLISEYGEVPFPARWDKAKRKGETLADQARLRLDALRSIAVGKVAPDIQGEDTNGKPMSLSDYRGKVVVLVFWGTWCSPCMGLVPHEKALVERFRDRPFAEQERATRRAIENALDDIRRIAKYPEKGPMLQHLGRLQVINPRADYHAAMRDKYELASHRPWQPVATDPPPP